MRAGCRYARTLAAVYMAAQEAALRAGRRAEGGRQPRQCRRLGPRVALLHAGQRALRDAAPGRQPVQAPAVGLAELLQRHGRRRAPRSTPAVPAPDPAAVRYHEGQRFTALLAAVEALLAGRNRWDDWYALMADPANHLRGYRLERPTPDHLRWQRRRILAELRAIGRVARADRARLV